MKMNKVNIKKQLEEANSNLNNSEFFGDAVNAVVDNQEKIVSTVFKMVTTTVVGLITVLIAVINIPFKLFANDNIIEVKKETKENF